MMRRQCLLGGRRFGRANIHAAVRLPRIARDDLTPQRLRRPQRHRGLPHRRGADNDEKRLHDFASNSCNVLPPRRCLHRWLRGQFEG